jgi:predicted metallopeptidase
MPIKYAEAPDVKKLADEIAEELSLFHVIPQFVFCFRSTGSTSEYTIARIHGLGRIWQEALNLPPSYAIEVISERYDRMSQAEKEKTIIHELLHVPEGFAGGFRPHKGYIDRSIVERLHRTLSERRGRKKVVSGDTASDFAANVFKQVRH